MRVTILTLAFMLLLASPSKGGNNCAVRLPWGSALNGLNFAYLEFDIDSFPPKDRLDIEAALGDAARNWNQGCGPVPVLNDQPYFVPARKGTLGGGDFPWSSTSRKLPVVFKAGLYPRATSCSPDQSKICYPLATTGLDDNGILTITVWEWSGTEGATVKTIDAYGAFFDRIFGHELGHALGLDHDGCSETLMRSNIEGILAGSGTMDSDHCRELEDLFEPPDPLSDLPAYDPDRACDNLVYYCDPFMGGFFSPWPRVRTNCLWVPDVTTAFFDYNDGYGNTWTSRGKTTMVLHCLPIFGLLQDPESGVPELFERRNGPTLMIQAPSQEAVASNGRIWLEGWTWGRDYPLRQLAVWINGEPATMIGWQTNQYSPEPCQAGVDPGYCISNGRFSGHVDVSGLSPGRYHLQVIATDMHEDPAPTAIDIPFVVPPPTPNHPPVAVNDSFVASVGIGAPMPITFDVVANDWDPDGNAVKLDSQAIFQAPTKGTVRRLDDRRLEYLPMPNASGIDTLVYRIEDVFGSTARATVTIEIMEAIILP